MSVFYAFSNNGESDMYFSVSKILGDLIIDTDNADKDNSNGLLDRIKKHIDSAQLFVCDLSPDSISPDGLVTTNANVMLELGYALDKFGASNIILIYDAKYNSYDYPMLKKGAGLIPSMLKGMYYIEYHTVDDIVDEIKKKLDNIAVEEQGAEWTYKHYMLPDNFINKIKTLLDVTSTYTCFRINKTKKQCVILFPCKNGKPRVLDIITKKLHLKDKKINLFDFPDLLEQLNHIELLANISWFKE